MQAVQIVRLRTTNGLPYDGNVTSAVAVGKVCIVRMRADIESAPTDMELSLSVTMNRNTQDSCPKSRTQLYKQAPPKLIQLRGILYSA